MSSGQPPDRERGDGTITASTILDYFTTVDNKIDETNSILRDIQSQLERGESVTREQNEVLSTLANALGEDVDLDVGREFPFLLSAEVPADTPANDPLEVTFENTPYESRLTRIVVNWPNGSQQAAGVNVGTPGGKTWVPRGGNTFTEDNGDDENPQYVALDDATITFNPDVRLEEGSPIRARYANTDDENNHFITTVVFLKEL